MAKVKLEARDGFWDLVFELRDKHKMKTALVTNSIAAVANKIIDSSEIRYAFDLCVFGDDVRHVKPSPEIFLKAAKELKVRPHEVLVFEDSVNGAAAADKAGMSLIVIHDGYVSRTRFPEKTVQFMANFDGLAGNLDVTAQEAFDEWAKTMRARKQKRLEKLTPQLQHQQTQTQPR